MLIANNKDNAVPPNFPVPSNKLIKDSFNKKLEESNTIEKQLKTEKTFLSIFVISWFFPILLI